jgi:hypothetical protein
MRGDQDYAYDKPADTIRIVSLGDSFTIGYEVHEEESFSRVLEQGLGKAGVKAEVLNCGVSGYSNAEALLYLERELLKYDPDIVVLSFFVNDLVDNARTGLFAIEEGKLVERNRGYVPGGKLANYLNTSCVFNTLSGYSNAFARAKERATRIIKRSLVKQHQKNMSATEEGADEVAQNALRQQQRFAALILDRLYETLNERGIPLVIQSIPSFKTMQDLFPIEDFDIERPGLHFLPMRPLHGR